MTQMKSPYIEEHRWGEITVRNKGDHITYRDAKVYPGGSRGWDWNETGTHHSPGIQRADVEELVENGAKVIVLSQGVYRRLQVCNETTEWLDELGIPYHILETKEAIKTYNALRKEKPVGGLFHSTC